ncbi:hypothetical protein OK351_13680 [Glutamicibacter sp. MNS18]|uniref:hypothetical protein n=1 Tax=Glutamicibacter sp. MNS18 TaxID=2989817 RepID=UPI0022367E37|nr:hypothetical protein [Glutamicibacter sp. MNS18]MCW4466544.1 hypothetical protein [Glutamicibacter sp. MNS18]
MARHGSRLLSSKKYDDLSTQLWELARERQALTPTGERFGEAVAQITEVHDRVGYGQLSVLGEREHAQTAERLDQRMSPVFERAAADGLPLHIGTSGVERAVDSALGFRRALIAATPELAAQLGEPQENRDLL